MTSTETTRIERLATRRRFGLMIAASAFLAWQIPLMDSFDRLAGSLEGETAGEGIRTLVSLGGFAIWIVALVLLVGPWRPFTSKRDEAMLNDELTQANRGKAFLAGYLAMMAASVVYFVLSMFEPVAAVEAAHMIMVAGVAVPMYAFAFLERG